MRKFLLLTTAAAIATGLWVSRAVVAAPRCDDICNFNYCDPPCGGYYECWSATKVCLDTGSYCQFQCYSGERWTEHCVCSSGNGSPVFVKPPQELDPP